MNAEVSVREQLRQRVNGEKKAVAPPDKRIHPIRKLARLHHACAVAVAQEYGVPLNYAFEKLTGAIGSVYIEANRRGFTVCEHLELPPLIEQQ